MTNTKGGEFMAAGWPIENSSEEPSVAQLAHKRNKLKGEIIRWAAEQGICGHEIKDEDAPMYEEYKAADVALNLALAKQE